MQTVVHGNNCQCHRNIWPAVSRDEKVQLFSFGSFTSQVKFLKVLSIRTECIVLYLTVTCLYIRFPAWRIRLQQVNTDKHFFDRQRVANNLSPLKFDPAENNRRIVGGADETKLPLINDAHWVRARPEYCEGDFLILNVICAFYNIWLGPNDKKTVQVWRMKDTNENGDCFFFPFSTTRWRKQ